MPSTNVCWENMEAPLSTLQACFPGKDERAAIKRRHGRIELFLSGPDDILSSKERRATKSLRVVDWKDGSESACGV